MMGSVDSMLTRLCGDHAVIHKQDHMSSTAYVSLWFLLWLKEKRVLEEAVFGFDVEIQSVRQHWEHHNKAPFADVSLI